MRRLVLLIALAGCAREAPREDAAGEALERAAIAAGVVRDPAARDFAGLYARDTDRVCIVAARGGYRIGASIDYGGGEGCGARGTVTRSGEALRVAFAGATGCSFDARLDQDRIVFPGEVPAACATLCSDRASFAALEVDLLSQVATEAVQLRDRTGRILCGS